MDPLELALSRTRRRAREGGAVLFIVAMTLAVLASVGVYALTAAATEVKTSGNERQNTQTHYLAEYGIVGAAHEVSGTKAQWYLQQMQAAPDLCPLSLPGVPTTADTMLRACWRIGSAEMSKAWLSTTPVTVKYSGAAPLSTTSPPGSFGAVPMTGDFFVELTEPSQAAGPARYGLDLHFCFIDLTATASGITTPVLAGATDPTTSGFAGEGLEVQRARFIAGPVQCPR
jgi:Tfp pilus assembly protein PilX